MEGDVARVIEIVETREKYRTIVKRLCNGFSYYKCLGVQCNKCDKK